MRKIFIFLFIFTLALSIRLTYLSTHQHVLESDEITYDRLGVNLAEGAGYTATGGIYTSHRPPLYSGFLALLYMVFGHNYFIVRFTQAIMGSLTAAIFYLIAEKVFNRITGIMTGMATSFYMTFVICTGFLYTETFFTLLLALTVYIAICTYKSNIIRFCALGLLCTLATLLKSQAFFLPIIILLYLATKMRVNRIPIKKITIASIALLLVFISTLLPWIIRNYQVHHRFVLVSTNAGMNMYVAVKPAYGKIIGLGPRGDKVSENGFAISDEVKRDKFFMKAAFRAYRENPLSAAKMFILRFLFFWNIIDWEIIGGETINYHFLFILPFAFFGTICSLQKRKDIFIPFSMILYFTSLVLVFQGTPRYRMPIDGYIIMLGSYGIFEIINRRKGKTMPTFCIGVYFLFTYFLYKYSLETKHFVKGLMQSLGLW